MHRVTFRVLEILCRFGTRIVFLSMPISRVKHTSQKLPSLVKLIGETESSRRLQHIHDVGAIQIYQIDLLTRYVVQVVLTSGLDTAGE